MAGIDQYHKPPEELSKETRDFARIINSLIKEADVINWYQKRVETIDERSCKYNASCSGRGV